MKDIKVAKFISGITHPLFILIFGLSFALFDIVIKHNPFEYVAFLFLVTVIPVYFYLWQLYKEKRNGNGSFSLTRENRNPVYLAAFLGAVFTVIICKAFNLNLFWMYNGMLLCIFFGVLYFVNKFIDKISLHAYVWSFVIIYLANAVSLYWLIGLLMLPFIAQARIVLEKHNKFQLFLGTSLGMFIALISWTFV